MSRARTRYSMRRRPVEALSSAEVDELYAFFSHHVVRERSEFEEKLRGIDELWVLRAAKSGAVLGIVAMHHVDTCGASVLHLQWCTLSRVLHGSNVLICALAARYLRIRLRHPGRPIYMVFAAATFSSYLAISRSLPRFWPRRGHRTPERALRVADGTMREVAGEIWDPVAGVIRGRGVWRYVEGVARNGRAPAGNADLAEYVRLNPGQHEGDALVCVFPAHLGNFFGALFSALRRSARRWFRSRTPVSLAPEVQHG